MFILASLTVSVLIRFYDLCIVMLEMLQPDCTFIVPVGVGLVKYRVIVPAC